MAKGDHDKAMNAINQQRNLQLGQQSQLASQFSSRYNNAYSSDQQLKDTITKGYEQYLDPNSDLMKSFAASLGGIGGVSGGIDPSHIANMGKDAYEGYKNLSKGVSPEFRALFDKSMADLDYDISGYKNFAETGGFTPQDIETMRAQAVAPTRQIYQNAQDELTRSNAVSGGNLGNIGLAQLRMAQGASDAIGTVNTNVESNLAQMKQQGKEFGLSGGTQASLAQAQARTAVEQLDFQMKAAGLGGMTDIEKTRLQAELENAQINESASAANANIGLRKAELTSGLPLEALKGLTGLYGTTPADTEGSARDQLALQELSQGGNLGLIGQQINASSIPGDFAQAMGNIGSVVGLAGNVAGAFSGLGSVGSAAKGLASKYTPGRYSSYGYGPSFEAGYG